MDTLMDILQWLVPVLGSAVVWLTNRTLRTTRTVKEVHDTYKSMYEDQQNTLIELRNENGNLYKKITRLEQVVSRAAVCRYWAVCPMRAELQDAGKYHCRKPDRKPAGQPAIRSPGTEGNRDTGLEADLADTDDKPP